LNNVHEIVGKNYANNSGLQMTVCDIKQSYTVASVQQLELQTTCTSQFMRKHIAANMCSTFRNTRMASDSYIHDHWVI